MPVAPSPVEPVQLAAEWLNRQLALSTIDDALGYDLSYEIRNADARHHPQPAGLSQL
jgi:hypothetical protein